jgi:TctA family transporter
LLGILPAPVRRLRLRSYAFEKDQQIKPNLAKAIEGVAGPRLLIMPPPDRFHSLLTLGLPSTAVMAMMVRAMMIHNIKPDRR